MKPVLFTLGSLSISSFGVFLLISLLIALFIIWRVIRVYELNEEKVIDLFLLIIAVGFIFARIYFVLFHLPQFNDITKVFLINRYPGLSFWGGFLGGLLTLKLFAPKFKANFWQISDFAVVGLFIGISISSIGCLLGSCQYGLPSNSTTAISQVGILSKRFPLQIIESIVFLIGSIILWRSVLKFHFFGAVFAKGLILLGIFKFILEFFRGDQQKLSNFSLGFLWAVLFIILGIRVYYMQSKKSLVRDFQNFIALFYNKNKRRLAVLKFFKTWYNLKVNLRVRFKEMSRSIFKLLNVKSNPNKF